MDSAFKRRAIEKGLNQASFNRNARRDHGSICRGPRRGNKQDDQILALLVTNRSERQATTDAAHRFRADGRHRNQRGAALRAKG